MSGSADKYEPWRDLNYLNSVVESRRAKAARYIARGASALLLGTAGYLEHRFGLGAGVMAVDALPIVALDLAVGAGLGIERAAAEVAVGKAPNQPIFDYGKWSSRIRTIGGTLIANAGEIMMGASIALGQQEAQQGLVAQSPGVGLLLAGAVTMAIGAGYSETAIPSVGRTSRPAMATHQAIFGEYGAKLPLVPYDPGH